MAELLGLATACFLAATLVPLPSEAALLVYLHFHPEHTALAVAVATVANTAGGMTSYLIGRLIPQRTLNSRALSWVHRFGAPATFLAFLPIVGDALCLAAGWLRVHWLGALGFMAAGRLARYLVVALLSYRLSYFFPLRINLLPHLAPSNLARITTLPPRRLIRLQLLLSSEIGD